MLEDERHVLESKMAALKTQVTRPGVEFRANLKSIFHRCHLFEVAFVWKLTKQTIQLPLGCLWGGAVEPRWHM